MFAFGLFNDNNLLATSDTCCYVDDIFEIEPEIIFKLNPKFISQLNKKDIKKISITHIGKNRTVSFPNTSIKKIEKFYNISITGTLATGQIHIIQTELVDELNLPSDHHLIQNQVYKFTTQSKELVAKTSEYISNHEHKDNIILEITEENNETIDDFNINLFLSSIKFVNWSFKPEYYISSVIPLSELKGNTQKYKSINNFFEIANISLKDFLSTTDHNIRNNLLRRVNREVSQILKQSWTQYQDVEIDITLGTDNALHVGFLENGHSIDPKRRSLGFQWFFAFLLHFNANFGNELRNCVILLDEPGIFLHPGGQKDLLKEIEKLANYNQIIYTTHLPFMINRNHPERIVFLNKKNGITFLKEPRKEGVFDDVLLANILGFNFSSISNFGEVNLFVEGITDKILIEQLVINYSQNFNEDLLDLNYISLIPINGVANLDSFIRVAQETKIRFLVLLDDDSVGKQLYKKYKDNPSKYNNAIDYFFKLKNDKEIEELIPFHIISSAFRNVNNNVEPWDKLIPKEKILKERNISTQIKEIIKEIKNEIVNNQVESMDGLNTPGKLKLDLMIEVKKLITEENCEEFNDLIEILREINKKGFDIIKKIREIASEL